jgi:pimeloyl-ACP methyl ester carboxylesterase
MIGAVDWAASVSNSAFVAVPKAGHAVHIERPEAAAALAAAFLRLDI